MADVSETSPLLQTPSPKLDDANAKNVVEFEDIDEDDPKQWPNTYKYGAVFLLALMAFTV